MADIRGEHAAHVCRQRKAALMPALALHRDLARPPIHVFERDRGNLPGAQPEPKQEPNDGRVAEADGGAIEGCQEPVDLAHLERFGDRG